MTLAEAIIDTCKVIEVRNIDIVNIIDCTSVQITELIKDLQSHNIESSYRSLVNTDGLPTGLQYLTVRIKSVNANTDALLLKGKIDRLNYIVSKYTGWLPYTFVCLDADMLAQDIGNIGFVPKYDYDSKTIILDLRDCEE